MSFVSDDKVTNLKITCADEKQIEKGTTHTIATVTYDAADVILHGAAQVACSFPNVAVADMPANISLTCTAGGAHGVETLNCTVYTVRSGFLRCATALSSTTPYTEIKLNITAAAAAHFTIPAGSDICMSLIPNEAQLTTTSMPEPPAVTVPTSYTLAPQSLNAACIDPLDPHKIMFFKNDSYWVFNMDTEALISGPTAITTLLSHYTNGDYIKYIHRASRIGANAQGEDVFHQVRTHTQHPWNAVYQASNGYQLVGNPNQGSNNYIAQAQTADQPWYVVFRLENGVYQVHHAQGQSTWEPYGPNTNAYPTLPAIEVDACVNDLVNGIVIVWQSAMMYKLNTTNKTVISSHQFGSS